MGSASQPQYFRVEYVTTPCPTCGAPRAEADGGSLRKARLGRGVGLNEMARRLGCSAAYLSDVELCRRRVTPKVLRQYDEVLR